MGFCLFREFGPDPVYFAVNVAHVESFAQVDQRGDPACLLKFPFKLQTFKPLVAGSAEQVKKILYEASKIGVGRFTAEIMTGRGKDKPMPLVMNNTTKIALVRELKTDEIGAYNENSPTVSQLYFDDGTDRLIAGRPGTFAMKVNADGRVPIL